MMPWLSVSNSIGAPETCDSDRRRTAIRSCRVCTGATGDWATGDWATVVRGGAGTEAFFELDTAQKAARNQPDYILAEPQSGQIGRTTSLGIAARGACFNVVNKLCR